MVSSGFGRVIISRALRVWKGLAGGDGVFIRTNLFDDLFHLCRRGSLLSTAIFVFAATSPVNGYFGGSLYARMGGQ